jgi:ribosomal protein S18 acetylase RimI-like enzyme
MQAPELVIVEAQLERPDHEKAVVAMTAAFALEVMGSDGPLPPDVLDQLVPALKAHPTTMVLLAFVQGTAIGIATCFIGFSTFAARPLVNVHDFAVLPAYRGKGIGRALLGAVEREARKRGCVKVTLEVQENNQRARRVYEAAGFGKAVYGEAVGGTLFYSKSLQDEVATQPGVATDGASPRR